jgi:hypothetical protein
VWARQLAGGDLAILFFNNNMTAPTDIACEGACWAAASRGAWGPNTRVSVRDVWARADNGTATGGVTARAVRTDATVFLRLSPA